MNSNKNRAVLFVGLLLLVATSLISLGIGALSLPIKEVIYALLSSIFDNINITTQTQSVVINVRLPRILTALICGAGLAAAGAAFQALFQTLWQRPTLWVFQRELPSELCSAFF